MKGWDAKQYEYHAKWQVLVPNCCKYRATGTRKEIKKKNKPYQTNLSHSSSLFLCQASHPSRSPRTSLSEVRNTMGLKSYNVFQHVKKSIGWHAYRCRITCCLCTWNSMSIYIWSRLSNYIMVFVVSLFQNHDTLVTAVTVFVYVCMYRIIFL